MSFKFIQKYLFIIVVFAFLWNQQPNIIQQKIDIENSYHQKISSSLSQMLGQERFLVIVSIEFSTVGGTLKKTASPQSGSGSSENPLYYLGLPTTPESKGSSNKYGSGSKTLSGKDLSIGRVEVIIGIDETSTTEPKKRKIISLIKEVIPQIKDCEDCIKIQASPFSNQKNAEMELLRQEVEQLQSDIRNARIEADDLYLEKLEGQLIKATTIINESEKEDSILFTQLVAAEKFRKEQDSIRFINTEERLDRVMESKIKSDSIIISEQMNILKHTGGGKDDKSLLGMQIGEGDSGIMGYVLIIFLVISLIIVTFLAANNKKPKTVYLKPKNKKSSAKNKSYPEGGNDAESASAPPPPRQDEDAMRSEIRSLRQTAVSLTVGEKEGASALIKEWLEDNPNKQEDSAAGDE